MKRFSLLFTLLVTLSVLLSACAGGAAPAEPAAPAAEKPAAEEPDVEEPAAVVALKVTGAVANEQAWTEDEVTAMNTLDVESTNSKGEKSSYTGVLLSELIAAAKPNADANMVTFIGESTAEVSLTEVMTCTDCIVSFRNKGGFSTVLPGYSGKMQVKGVVEIQISAP